MARRRGQPVQFLSASNGTPLWVSDAEPGSTPDVIAARAHCLGALRKAVAVGLPTLADSGYRGAGIGVHHPASATSPEPHSSSTGLESITVEKTSLRAGLDRPGRVDSRFTGA